MSLQSYDHVELVYGLEDKLGAATAFVVALQHLMGMVMGIVLPSVIIADALELPPDMKIYLINVALFVSGVGTLLQVGRPGPVGSGLLTMQGTSFIFVGALISVGMGVREQGPEAMVAAMSGIALMGSLVQIALSRMARLLRIIFPPLVTGVTVTLVGLSLVEMAMRDACGGMAAQAKGDFASPVYLALAVLVLVSILFFQRLRQPVLRACAILLGLAVGCVAAYFAGVFSVDAALATFSSGSGTVPMPLRYGISFGWEGLLSFALLYVLSTVEAVGDIAATSLVSKRPVDGPEYMGRLRGGICCDGVASALAAVFNSFPMAIFALNNGVIQVTGVASRRVGYYVGGILILTGLVPFVGALFAVVPAAVMGGAMLLVFGTVAAAGVKIIATVQLDRRALTIVGLGLAAGLGVAFVPELSQNLPGVLGQLTQSAVTAGGLTAIVANLCLPQKAVPLSPAHAHQPVAHESA